MDKIDITLPNGDHLVAEECPFEGGQIAVGITNADGIWLQDLTVVETSGKENNSSYNVYVFGSEYEEGYTECYEIKRIPDDAI